MASDGTGYDDHVDLRRAVATRAPYGFVIEKVFQEGRLRLEKHDWEVHSHVKVTGLANGVISIEP